MLWQITGWILWALCALFALSGIIYNIRAARTGGTVTYMGLFQFGASLILSVLFIAMPWNKNHLVYIIPLVFLLSHTRIGAIGGNAVGLLVKMLFGRRSDQEF